MEKLNKEGIEKITEKLNAENGNEKIKKRKIESVGEVDAKSQKAMKKVQNKLGINLNEKMKI